MTGADLLAKERLQILHLSGWEFSFVGGKSSGGKRMNKQLKMIKVVFASWISAVRKWVSQPMVVSATLPFQAASGLTLVPVLSCCSWFSLGLWFLTLSKLKRTKKRNQKNCYKHVGELYSVITFFHLSFVLQGVVFPSNYDLTVPILGIILIFMPVNNHSKMKGLVLVWSKPL